uniref:electron transport complex subunit RsxE n=1 Tax=Prevotella sp. TaxID=59823 RepID=UPI003FEEEA07
MNSLKIIVNGLIKENPTFVLLLGMCPTLATTTSLINGISMGLSTAFVLICSNIAISLIKNLTPDAVRIPVFVVVIASFVTVLQMCLAAFFPSINSSLGLYIPLIVVNCIILGRAEAFACKHGALDSMLDGIGVGLGFTLGLSLLGFFRELLGTGCVLGIRLLPETAGMLLFILPPGAFITLGYLIAVVNRLRAKQQ